MRKSFVLTVLLVSFPMFRATAARAQTQDIRITKAMAEAAVAENAFSGIPEWLNLEPSGYEPLYPMPSTQDIYLAQTATGGNTGADCADALVLYVLQQRLRLGRDFYGGEDQPRHHGPRVRNYFDERRVRQLPHHKLT
jgi:hypothetical protein